MRLVKKGTGHIIDRDDKIIYRIDWDIEKVKPESILPSPTLKLPSINCINSKKIDIDRIMKMYNIDQKNWRLYWIMNLEMELRSTKNQKRISEIQYELLCILS